MNDNNKILLYLFIETLYADSDTITLASIASSLIRDEPRP
jgi:hypothetical protein